MKVAVAGPLDDAGHADPGHPERPERARAANEAVADLRLGSDLVVCDVRDATREELLRAHDAHYLDQLGAFCYEGGGDLDADTYATYDSWSISRRAAGAGLAVVDELRRRGEGVGFVATRPPGHHALRDRAMGFCLLNNVAIAAAALADAGERVFVLDWDVHHGNGTQAIFWDDPRVLYVSTHQSPLYPGSGAVEEVGGVHAAGLSVNLPLPAGATGDVVLRALEVVAAPVVDAFRPTWVLVSAGFDAHRLDPLADLALTSGDFAALASWVGSHAAPGRCALFLEGGYHLDALRDSVAASLGALLGADVARESQTSGGPGADLVDAMNERRERAINHLVRTAREDTP